MLKAIIIGQIPNKVTGLLWNRKFNFHVHTSIFVHLTRCRVTKIQINHSFPNTHSNIFILLPINSPKNFFLQVFQFKYCRKIYNVCYTPVSLVPFYFVTKVTFSKQHDLRSSSQFSAFFGHFTSRGSEHYFQQYDFQNHSCVLLALMWDSNFFTHTREPN